MQLDKILSISGRPGLFEMEAQTRGGIVARSLVDGKRVTTSVNNQVSVLSEIQIYCIGTEVPLAEVFEKILKKEDGKNASVSPKAAASDLEAYFFDILDNYDEDRVYSSDIKKVIQWYNILLQNKRLSSPKPKTKKKTDKTETNPSSTPTKE